jgi:hypothetical protein
MRRCWSGGILYIPVRTSGARSAKANAPLLVLDLGLDVVDGVGRLHLEGDRLTREGLDKNLEGSLSQSSSATGEMHAYLHFGVVEEGDRSGQGIIAPGQPASRFAEATRQAAVQY